MKAILMRSDWTKQLSVAATRRHGCARVVGVCHFPWALMLHHYRSTICLPEPRGGGGQLPPGTVEPDKSSLWMDLFPLDSVILIVVTCICFQFSRGRIQTLPPATRLVPSAVAIMPPPPPRGKKTCYGPAYLPQRKPQRPSSLTIRKS